MRPFLIVSTACALACATGAHCAPRRADAPKTAAGGGARMVCRTYVRAGTLADRHRVCKTQAEWNEERNMRELDRSQACRMSDDPGEPCK